MHVEYLRFEVSLLQKVKERKNILQTGNDNGDGLDFIDDE